MHFNNGFSFGCVIYHRFLYRLQKIVILKSNYCQGKFHLFFAIEHAQKLKSLVKVAENEILGLKNLYTSMTTEVELCKQMIGDGIAHGIIVKVGVILALPEWIFLNEKFLRYITTFNFNLQRFSYRVVNGIGWFSHGSLKKNVVLIWVANLPKVRFCYRVVVGIPGRTSVPILNLSTPPPGPVN